MTLTREARNPEQTPIEEAAAGGNPERTPIRLENAVGKRVVVVYMNEIGTRQKFFFEVRWQALRVGREQRPHLQFLEIDLAVAEDVMVEGPHAVFARPSALIWRDVLVDLGAVYKSEILCFVQVFDRRDIASPVDPQRKSGLPPSSS